MDTCKFYITVNELLIFRKEDLGFVQVESRSSLNNYDENVTQKVNSRVSNFITISPFHIKLSSVGEFFCS